MLSARVLAVFVITSVYVILPSFGWATIAPCGSAVVAALACIVSVPAAVALVSVVVAEALLFVQLVSGCGTAVLQVGSTWAASVAVPVVVVEGMVPVILMVALAPAASAVPVVHFTPGSVTVQL